MSQRSVERVIGRLVTDEDFRRQFEADPIAALGGVAAGGVELTEVETRALAGLDARLLARVAEAIDPRLQKLCIREGRRGGPVLH